MRPIHTVDPFRKGYRAEDRPLPPEEKRMQGYLDRQHALSDQETEVSEEQDMEFDATQLWGLW